MESQKIEKTTLTCPCGTRIVGVGEDDLVVQTQDHLAAEHPGLEYERVQILFIAS